MTVEQTAAYLQVSRATVLRYIRDGRLIAARLGRGYRITKQSADRLFWSERVRPDIELRSYTAEQIAQFVTDDQLDIQAVRALNSYRNHQATPQT